MSIEQYNGVHATCMEYAPLIEEEGFKLSSEGRYLGAGVYFYDKDKEGATFANIHRQHKIKYGHCKENDTGVLISAEICSRSENILDLDEYEDELEAVEKDFWEEYNHINIPHTEKIEILNRSRTNFLLSLVPDVIESIDFVKTKLPYKRKEYGRGFVVYNLTCISNISY